MPSWEPIYRPGSRSPDLARNVDVSLVGAITGADPWPGEEDPNGNERQLIAFISRMTVDRA